MRSRRIPSVLSAALLAFLAFAVTAGNDPSGDFDFWQGEWTVTVQAAMPDGSWQSAEGKSNASKVAGGNAHMESIDTGQYKSRGIRAFNVATGMWDYTMFDNLQMKGLKVWSGKFEDGVGTIEGKMPLPTGAPANTKIVIDNIENDSFKWRFDLSMDGETWRTVMKMDFQRGR